MSFPTKYTAIVRKRVTYRSPALNTAGRQILLGPDQKELPKDDNGKYIGDGIPKFEETKTESTENPVMDDAGNQIEAGSPESLLHKVKEHFADERETEVLGVTVLETKAVREISGAEFAKL